MMSSQNCYILLNIIYRVHHYHTSFLTMDTLDKAINAFHDFFGDFKCWVRGTEVLRLEMKSEIWPEWSC